MAKRARGKQTEGRHLPAVSDEEWESQLAAHARDTSAVVAATGGAQYISTRGGKFAYQEELLQAPLRVIVLDAVRENVYYPEAYDPEDPQPPACFAIGREEGELAPPPDLETKEADRCAECWANKFGTARQGKGKACKNTARLALLPAAQLDPAALVKQEPALLRLPVTSVREFAKFARKVEGGLRRALFGVVTFVGIEPDSKNQYRVTFDLDEQVPPSAGGVVLAKREDVKGDLERLPERRRAEEGEQEPTRKRATRRKARGAKF